MPKSPDPLSDLTRRERQAMEVLYGLGQATASEVHERLPDPPGYSSVRSMLRGLEDKRLVRHVQDGPRYLYLPTVSREKARSSALRHVLKTFFDGSSAAAVAALLDLGDADVDADTAARIRRMIEQAKDNGR